MKEQSVGTILELYRYPVKSMIGETHDRLPINKSGVEGDRAIALIDVKTGKVVTAKQPALWKAMLTLRAMLQEDGTTVVVMPTGEQLVMQDDKSAHVLSEFLGRPVRVSFTRTMDIEMERADPLEVINKGTQDLVPFETMPVAQGNSQSDNTILAPLIKENIQPFLDGKRLPSLGVYAEVVCSGVVAKGDKVRLKPTG